VSSSELLSLNYGYTLGGIFGEYFEISRRLCEIFGNGIPCTMSNIILGTMFVRA
jgi:hypothetical protein